MSIRFEALSKFLQGNPFFIYICLGGVIITEIPILCCTHVAQKVPTNYILLFLFTLFESFLVAFTTTFYEPKSVLICVCLTLAVVIGLTLFSIFTKTDMTVFGGLLTCFCIILFFLTNIGIFFRSELYQTFINACGVLLFSLYLIYDTQIVIGKNKHLLKTDGYIIGALIIYIDIVSLFIKILALFGKKKK